MDVNLLRKGLNHKQYIDYDKKCQQKLDCHSFFKSIICKTAGDDQRQADCKNNPICHHGPPLKNAE
jgi:hypothetical protein